MDSKIDYQMAFTKDTNSFGCHTHAGRASVGQEPNEEGQDSSAVTKWMTDVFIFNYRKLLLGIITTEFHVLKKQRGYTHSHLTKLKRIRLCEQRKWLKVTAINLMKGMQLVVCGCAPHL